MTDTEKVEAIKQLLQDYVEGKIETPIDLIRMIRQVAIQ